MKNNVIQTYVNIIKESSARQPGYPETLSREIPSFIAKDGKEYSAQFEYSYKIDSETYYSSSSTSEDGTVTEPIAIIEPSDILDVEICDEEGYDYPELEEDLKDWLFNSEEGKATLEEMKAQAVEIEKEEETYNDEAFSSHL